MLKILIKKQLYEVFKGYFYDAKKNKMRSKGAIAAYFVMFFLIMAGLLGGIFTGLSLSLCGPLTERGLGWMYFLMMGGIALLLGAFGSVFNSYASLYLSKDNDLLLSLPIPIRTIIASRLVNVYLLGAMYAAVVFLPALIVGWIVAGVTAGRLIGGILLFVLITVIVLLLSCLLGMVVAKLSLKLKNKSFLTVFSALIFLGGYYFVYFKANGFIREILENADAYGKKIKGAAYGLYLFGRIGEGDFTAALIVLAVTAVISAVVWRFLSRSFFAIAAAGGNTGKIRYTEKRVKEKSVSRALLGKEFARFTSSPNYMLNCGLGTILIPISGVLMLIKGKDVFGVLNDVFAARAGSAAVILCLALCLISSMNDMAAPSVSLEGKNIWIPQSLPVEPKKVLRAKALMQIILTGLPILFASLCMLFIMKEPLSVKVLFVLMPLAFVVFSALFDTFIGLRMPLLNWTNEIAPIKQSASVFIAMFGGWGAGAVMLILYFAVGYRIGAAVYLLIWTVLLAAASLLLMKWLDTKGAARFAEL